MSAPTTTPIIPAIPASPGRPISIRERIVRAIKAAVEAMDDVNSCLRWDGTGTQTWSNGDVILDLETEPPPDESPGNPGALTCTMPAVLAMTMIPASGDTVTTDEAANYWQAALKKMLADNRLWHEPATGIRLAIETTFGECGVPKYLQGIVNTAIHMSIVYRHDGDSPYKWGSAIAETYDAPPAS